MQRWKRETSFKETFYKNRALEGNGRPLRSFSWRSPTFHWSPQIIIGVLQWKSLCLQWKLVILNKKYGIQNECIGVSNENVGSSLKIFGVFNENLKFSNKIGGLKQKFWVTNKNLLGFQMWILRVSNENLGGLQWKSWGSPMKIWGS